ncbi:elongator complex protein 3 [Syntrophomonas palmitatica]|uniref:elongator complex protein 3 n=1 Tax=Syntrophomonas palmitatica TaxID=402877 RepID=UPI0006D1AFC2|nr:radical SAM protein [Syntrophomonas palmitatica]
MKHYNIPIFITHLGCPYQCIYCDQRTITNQEQAYKPSEIPALVEKHLATISGDDKEIEIAFFGGSFTTLDRELQERYLDMVQPFLQNGKVHGIRISTRPDYIDKAVLDFLKTKGVKTVELGVQSLSDEVLKASGRGYKSTDVSKACHLIKQSGLRLGLQLMIGLPGDDHDKALSTCQRAIRLRPDMVRIYPTLVLAGTTLAEFYYSGRYQALSLEQAVNWCKDMLVQFEKAGINVIRMGLYPGEDLQSDGVVIAGPFHPAFGELVEQELFKEQAQLLLNKYINTGQETDRLSILVHPRDLSRMIGQKRRNLHYLQRYFHLADLSIRPSPNVAKGNIGISLHDCENPLLVLNRTEYLELCQI